MTDSAPSKHTTRQEVEKAPRTSCRACGLSGVSAMVRDRQCVNVPACERRQRNNAKRKPATAAEQVAAAKAEAAAQPKKAKAGK